MKKSTFLICFLFVAFFQAKSLDLGVSHVSYATPDQPYVEVSIEIPAASIFWKSIDSTSLEASAEIIMMFKQGDQVIAFDKYVLASPKVSQAMTLLDVKRFALAPGEYTLEVSAQDLGQPENKNTRTSRVTVVQPVGMYMTELNLLRGFRSDTTKHPLVKNGFFMEPLPFAFYEPHATLLACYAEVYRTAEVVKDPAYLVRYFIDRELGNGQTKLVSVGTQRKRPSKIDAILLRMDIADLETGNYSLTVEIRNMANELLTSKKIVFQRSNPFLQFDETQITQDVLERQFVKDLDEKTLRYSLKALTPMVTMGTEPEELKNILKTGDVQSMRFFLFRFFARQDPNNPETAWRKYLDTAIAADKQFQSGFRHGFETDRGRTYMKYGLPDDRIRVEDDPAAPPYEIWVYYNFPKTQQSNVKFLFYNPTLAGEDFVLLHSNARGEINNPKWERELYRRNAGEEYEGDDYQGSDRMQRNVNRNARVYFEDF